MQTLYLVTHPQSVHHVEGRGGGWYDTHPMERGRAQAAAIAAARRAVVTLGETDHLAGI
jgi:probable phosphoglycerate mutase